MLPIFIESEQIDNFAVEFIPREVSVYFTRKVEMGLKKKKKFDVNTVNFLNNKANLLRGNRITSLGDEPIEEYDEHIAAFAYGEVYSAFNLLLVGMETVMQVEMLGELITLGFLDSDEVNKTFEHHGVGIKFCRVASTWKVELTSLEEMEGVNQAADTDDASDHTNIRLLLERASRALEDADYTGVLHACASTLEALSKVVISDSNIENQPLGSYFQKYRKMSGLPAVLLDYVEGLYKKRNSTPNAGHGSTPLFHGTCRLTQI